MSAPTYGFDGPLVTKSTADGTVDGEVAVTYDADLRQATETAAGVPATFEYDNDGMITKAGNLTLTRDPDNGLLTGLNVGNSTTAVTYNELGELVIRGDPAGLDADLRRELRA